MLRKFRTHDKGIMAEVVALYDNRRRSVKGAPWSIESWNKAYEIVWAKHALETQTWRLKHRIGVYA